MELDDSIIIDSYLEFIKDKDPNDLSHVLAYFSKLMAAEPTNYIAWQYFNVLKHYHLKKDEAERIKEIYKVMVTKEHSNDELCEHYTALAYLSAVGDEDELRYLKFALKQMPEHVPLLIKVANKTPDKSEAIRYLEKALSLDPDNDAAKKYYAHYTRKCVSLKLIKKSDNISPH